MSVTVSIKRVVVPENEIQMEELCREILTILPIMKPSLKFIPIKQGY